MKQRGWYPMLDSKICGILLHWTLGLLIAASIASIAYALAALVLHASPRDDCDGVMAALVAAQSDVYTDLDNIGALEAAIAAPAWDPVLDGWMVPALGWANEDLIGDLNTASIAAEQAHQAHCY